MSRIKHLYELERQGYYIKNLWHVSDVQSNHDVTDDEALEVLNKVMGSEYVVSMIFEMIDEEMDNRNKNGKRKARV